MATYNTSKKNKKDTSLNKNWVTSNGNTYPIYKEAKTGKYYIVDKNGKQSYFSQQSSINAINNAAKGATINLNTSASKAVTQVAKAVTQAAKDINKSIDTTNRSGMSYDDYMAALEGDGAGGGFGGGYDDLGGYDDRYEQGLQQYVKDPASALTKPKVWTADELAKHYGVEDLYNQDYINRMYQDATNKYYTDAVNEQLRYNKDAELSNSLYANQLLRSYVNSYNNAAPTAVGKGAVAANALNTMLGADMANETASSNLNNIVNDYKQQQQKDLVNDIVEARNHYETIGKWLLEQGVNTNTAEVQNYINSLEAYQTAYAGIRNAQVNLAKNAAAAYQQSAQASIANATYNAQNAADNILNKVYQAYYGNYGNAQAAYNANKQQMELQSNSGNVVY